MTWTTARSISAMKSRESLAGTSSASVLQDKVGAPENWRRESRLATLLHALDGLQAEDVPVVEEADREIWGYLSAFDGITSQTQALRHLAEAFQSRPATSALHRVICNLLAQHHRRLADGTESVLIANT
jgi:hypothetical protein